MIMVYVGMCVCMCVCIVWGLQTPLIILNKYIIYTKVDAPVSSDSKCNCHLSAMIKYTAQKFKGTAEHFLTFWCECHVSETQCFVFLRLLNTGYLLLNPIITRFLIILNYVQFTVYFFYFMFFFVFILCYLFIAAWNHCLFFIFLEVFESLVPGFALSIVEFIFPCLVVSTSLCSF